MQVQSLCEKNPLATHSNILAWKIPWTEQPGSLQSMGSQSRTQLTSTISLRFVLHGLFNYCKHGHDP